VPIYTAKCPDGHETDYFSTIQEKDYTPKCKLCDKQTRKIISLFAVHPDIQPYLDPNIGDKPIWVTSKQHRKKLMQEHGVTESYGKGWF